MEVVVGVAPVPGVEAGEREVERGQGERAEIQAEEHGNEGNRVFEAGALFQRFGVEVDEGVVRQGDAGDGQGGGDRVEEGGGVEQLVVPGGFCAESPQGDQDAHQGAQDDVDEAVHSAVDSAEDQAGPVDGQQEGDEGLERGGEEGAGVVEQVGHADEGDCGGVGGVGGGAAVLLGRVVAQGQPFDGRGRRSGQAEDVFDEARKVDAQAQDLDEVSCQVERAEPRRERQQQHVEGVGAQVSRPHEEPIQVGRMARLDVFDQRHFSVDQRA